MEHNDIIDFDEEFNNLTEDEINHLIELEWQEQQAGRLNPTGLTSKIIEEYEDWYEGDINKKEFLYKKIIELNECAEGYMDEEERSLIIEALKKEIFSETSVTIQSPKVVLTEKFQNYAPNVSVIDTLNSLNRGEMLTLSEVFKQMGDKEVTRVPMAYLKSTSNSPRRFRETFRKLEGAGLHFGPIENGIIEVRTSNKELAKETILEINKIVGGSS